MSTSPPLFSPFLSFSFPSHYRKIRNFEGRGGGKRDDRPTPGKRILASPQNQNKIHPPPTSLACAIETTCTAI